MDALVVFGAKYLVLALPLAVIWLWLSQPKSRRAQLALAVVLSGVAAFLLAKVTAGIYDNPRPFISDQVTPLFSHADDNGFPSEHTVFATTLAAVIYFYHRRLAAAGLAASILVGWARVLADVHHAVDVVAGLAIGATAGLVGYWLASKIWPDPKPEIKPQD